MQVEGAEPGRLQHRLGQDLAIGDDHGGIEVQGPESGDLVQLAHRRRRPDLKAQLLGESLDWRGAQLLAPATRRRRLGIDRRDLVARGDELGEGFDREVGGAEEGQAHAGGLAAPAASA